MKSTRDIMGMPVTVQVNDGPDPKEAIDLVFNYFAYVDEKFSTYKPDSEISRINRGELAPEEFSADMKEVFQKAARTKAQTHGFFDIVTPQGDVDPSGLVKGWAIQKAAELLRQQGASDFFIDAGGDIQASRPEAAVAWSLGIRHPAEAGRVVKVLAIRNEGVATSGNYLRGRHIDNPRAGRPAPDGVVSLTVIGPDIYEADRFATAAFAMGREGINFLERQPGLEGYLIDSSGRAVQTSGFVEYVA